MVAVDVILSSLAGTSFVLITIHSIPFIFILDQSKAKTSLHNAFPYMYLKLTNISLLC